MRRLKGSNWRGLFFPWFYTLHKSQHLALNLTEPEEFFDQLCVAYEKWQRTNVKGNQ